LTGKLCGYALFVLVTDFVGKVTFEPDGVTGGMFVKRRPEDIPLWVQLIAGCGLE
jgi:hypothetical protein